MLEVEITQQRSIHTTKWEIVLGMLILILNQLNFFILLLSGMSLYQVIKLLKQNDDQIKSVILVYNDKVKHIE
jgi:type IV secretory pathway VirB3-like protein